MLITIVIIIRITMIIFVTHGLCFLIITIISFYYYLYYYYYYHYISSFLFFSSLNHCHYIPQGSFLIRRQRGHPGVVLQLVISNSANPQEGTHLELGPIRNEPN